MNGGFQPALQFPIFTIQADGKVYITTKNAAITYRKWSKSLAKDESYYKCLRIVDAQGGLFKILKVEILERGSLLDPKLWFTQQVVADTYVEKIETLELSKVKEILLNSVIMHQDYYESADVDWNELQAKITHAKDMPDLFELIAYAQGAD